jgi:hypothetical protein
VPGDLRDIESKRHNSAQASRRCLADAIGSKTAKRFRSRLPQLLLPQSLAPEFVCERVPIFGKTNCIMPTAKQRASTILTEFHKAESELAGTAVVLTDGKAGTVEHVWLDELHGLRISVRGHEGKWPVSTIKLAQSDLARASGISRRPRC